MESGNKKIVIGLICLILLILIGLSIYQNQQVRKLSEGGSSEEYAGKGSDKTPETVQDIQRGNEQGVLSESNENVANKNMPDTPTVDATANISELEERLDAREKELDMIHNQISAEEARKAELLEKELELARKRLEDPASKKSMRNVLKASLDSRYALLLKRLNLAPENQERFMEILLDQEMASMEQSVELIDDPVRGKQIVHVTRSKDPGDEYKTKIADLLGDENFKTYQEYGERGAEVHWVTQFDGSLSSDERLTDDQQMELINAMYNNREKVKASMVNTNTKSESQSEMTEEDIEANMKRTELMHEAYVEAAEGILSDAQTDQLKAYLKSIRDMLEENRKTMSQINTDKEE
ncbi:MAG: hypothetical protein JW944_05895 [Deltaproteobacteria bacterium]|nr:hypothetical protein [Deltaproteobacteria bacterium]